MSAGLKTSLFEPSHLPLDGARVLMAARLKAAASPPDRHIPLADETQRVLRAAVEEADARHHQGVGLAHLLLGVLREGDAPAAALLGHMRIGAEQVRAGLDAYLQEETA